VVKSTQMRQVGHFAHMGRGEVHTGFGLGTLGKRSLGKPRHKWEHNIKMDLQVEGWAAWMGFIWLRTKQVVGFCECGNEP